MTRWFNSTKNDSVLPNKSALFSLIIQNPFDEKNDEKIIIKSSRGGSSLSKCDI